MVTLPRMLRHLLCTTWKARRAFPAATLQAIQQEIGAGETRHRAELRLIIEPALSTAQILDGLSARGRAHELFSHYRLWDTEENCGVLIYLNLADHSVDIITDRGIGQAVARADWEAACRTMTAGFAAGRFHESALAGISHVNALLGQHFPADGTDRSNELSDRPLIL